MFKFQFRENLSVVLVFSILLLLILSLFRLISVIAFGNWQDLVMNAGYLDDLFFKGFRFDLKLLSSILLVLFWFPVLLSWLIPRKFFFLILKITFSISLLLLIFLAFVDMGHLYYFQRPIDVLVFGVFEDDTRAIFSTILGNYQLLFIFLGFLITVFLVARIFSKQTSIRQLDSDLSRMPLYRQLLIWIISLLVLIVFARGSLDTFPLQRKHASVSDNTFINSMVMNSVFNLYYAYSDRKVSNQGLFQQDILKANGLSSLDELVQRAGYGPDNPLQRTTESNPKLEKLRPHVIFVLMEGWSTQIARAQSEQNNVLGEFARHAQQDHYFTQFFTNQYATNPSIEALLMNSPITPLSQSLASNTPLSLSNVLPFKQKDYQTLFLSGGYSSWRNHNNFWLQQGFDRYVGRSEIERFFSVDASDNPWGVYDEYLFKYLIKSIEDAEQMHQALFSFVLTTNNHSPVRLPKTYRQPPLDPSVYGLPADDPEKISILTGYNYQSDQLGRFISWVKQSDLKDKVIIVATGDHPHRLFIDNSASADKYLRYSVPAYFYVPESLDKLKNVPVDLPGSHNDLFPTLFELSLSQADYFNFGQVYSEKNRDQAYGRSTDGQFLFEQGVVDSRNDSFYRWLDNEKYLLNAEPLAVPYSYLPAIANEESRRILKQYLIVRDYQQQTIKQ